MNGAVRRDAPLSPRPGSGILQACMDHDVSGGLDHAEAETAARPDIRHRASGAPLPARIGPYHIIELLGQGGMGAVYLAEQTQPFRRRVAVKVIKPGMDSEQVIARFETERQALALMNHPNVARVLDAVSEGARAVQGGGAGAARPSRG